MKGLMGFLKVGVIGFAVVAGGVAAYRYRDKLAGTWKNLKGIEGLKGHAGKLALDRVFGAVPTLKPFRSLVGQYAHLK